MEDLNAKLQRARAFYNENEHTKALEVLADPFVQAHSDNAVSNFLQGAILKHFADASENNPDRTFTFLLGSAECFSTTHAPLAAFAATSLFKIAQQIRSVLYYKESVYKASVGLDAIEWKLAEREFHDGEEENLKHILSTAESRIAESKKCDDETVTESKEEKQTKKSETEDQEPMKSEILLYKDLCAYWAGLSLESKRNFMKVSVAELTSYVERLYGEEGRDVLEEVLAYARGYRKWRFWLCRICSKRFFASEKCRNHLEQEHGAEYKAPLEMPAIPQRISKAWGRKITSGDWEPVEVVAAVQMIKDQLEDVKAFTYENGWSKDWPLAADEERRELLKDIRKLLVLFLDRTILSCSIRDRVMLFVVNHFESFEVSKLTLTECRLAETPQSICFLECCELSQILDFLKNVKCVRDDGTHLVSRAVDSFRSGTQVSEKIDFDSEFSFLLLDKRLTQKKLTRFDDEGTISVFPRNDYYAKAHFRGDAILCWLASYGSGDGSFRFPKPIRAHSLDIWLAVLRAVQFMCRNLERKYAKKVQVLDYDADLADAKNLCNREDEKRRNLQGYQPNRYAALLCDECEQRHAEDFLYKGLFLNVVQDVLNEASCPTFEDISSFSGLQNWQKFLPKHPSDDIVLKSIDHMKLMVTNKVPLIDSKILLIEKSRMSLVNDLTKISVFDYRSYILRPLKEFLLDGIVDRETKATLAAIEADLLPEEEKKSLPTKAKNKCSKEELDGIVDMDVSAKSAQAVLLSKKKQEKEKKSGSKMKKHRSNKITSPSMSSLPEQNVKHESSVNIESGPSLKLAEEESMELEDTLSVERDQLKILASADNQEEAAKDMQNMPGEGAAVTRRYLALDMTLKALCNIKAFEEALVHNRQQFPENLEKGVSLALRHFFIAFFSEVIKEEGLYDDLLSELLASLEGVWSMSSDAAELLVNILQFWPYWKSPERENLVTCLFRLEEYEKMACSKCRRKSNCSEQSCYGIVMAADSVRDLKCAFGNIKFEDILKVICMDYNMLCDNKTGGCGKENFVEHTISRRPPIFTIVLEWEKDDTEKEISDTTKALEWEIDMSRLYKGLEQNTNYRLVSMIVCGEKEEEEYICLAYKKNRWVSFRHGSLAKEAVVGNWTNVVRFCGEKKIRPEILFYEAVQWPSK